MSRDDCAVWAAEEGAREDIRQWALVILWVWRRKLRASSLQQLILALLGGRVRWRV